MAKILDSVDVSAFFEGVSMMLSAGIQTDEAAALMGDNLKSGDFKSTCAEVYRALSQGRSMSEALKSTGRFPEHALNMVAAGEESGSMENAMRSLAVYYSEDARLNAKIRNGVVYPMALLGVMTVILAFTVAVILPVFLDVYRSLSGEVAVGAFSYVNVSLVIGWVAFALMALCTVVALVLVAASSTPRGRARVTALFSRLPYTRQAMYRHALSRFTSLLATYVAAGFDSNESMRCALESVDNVELRRRVQAAYREMTDPAQAKSLAQAVSDNEIYDPVYARMLTVGARSGSEDRVLSRLADAYFEQAVSRMDDLVDGVEPLLAAVLTVGVGATLVTVMIPLVGIMGSIG